jgi:hypothetical protein
MRRVHLTLRVSLIAAALVAASSAIASAQDFEGSITIRVKGMPGGGPTKAYVKGVKYRVELSAPQGEMAIITDPEAGETYMVMPARSMYMVMKLSDAEQLADSLVRRNVSGEATLTALGKQEEIAGHRCEYFRFRDAKSATDMCITTGLGVLRGGAWMFGGGMPGRGRAETPPWVRELLRKGAFPLKVADTTGVPIWEVLALERKSLEASLFVPPANFQRMQMPGRPPQ